MQTVAQYRNALLMRSKHAAWLCKHTEIAQWNKYPQEPHLGVARSSESKQAHVGSSISILGTLRTYNLQIKTIKLHAIFKLKLNKGLQGLSVVAVVAMH